MITRNSVSIRLWVALAIAIPLWLTLRGDPAAALAADRTPWHCISCGAGGTADLLQNSLLLLPLGMGLALLGWRLGSSALLLLLLPIGIELAQGAMAAGRDAALGDVLANATGGLLGWFAGRERWRLLWPDPRRAAPLVWGVFVAQLLATATLNLASPVGPEPLALRLVPEVPGRPAYRGAVEQLTLGGRSILADSPPLAQPQLTDHELQSRFAWDPSDNPLPGTIARLDDSRDWAIFSIDRRADAIAMTLRTRGSRLRLREPTWLLPVPAGVVAGDVVDASLTLRDGHASMTLASRDATAALQLRFGAQHGWSLINPFTPVHSSPTAWNWWTLAWLAGWGVLLGWFTTSGAMGGSVPRPYTWLGLSVAALLLVTAMSATRATPMECVALVTGWFLAMFSRRLLPPRPAGA